MASPASTQPLIPASRISHILRGLGVPEDAAELAATLPPAFATVVSGTVRVACVLNDGAWAASTDLNDEEVCDTAVVLAAWRKACSEASAALDALLSGSLDSRTPLFPRRTDTEAAFSAFRGTLDAAVNRRIARRIEYDASRKRRMDELGASIQVASRVASAVGLGVTALSFCAGASFLPGLLLARSAVAVAGAGVVKSVAGSIPTLAQVGRGGAGVRMSYSENISYPLPSLQKAQFVLQAVEEAQAGAPPLSAGITSRLRGRPPSAAAPSPDSDSAAAAAPSTPGQEAGGAASSTPASSGSGGGGSSSSTAGQKRRRAPEQDVGTAEAVVRLATARTRSLLGHAGAAGSPLTPGALKPSARPNPTEAALVAASAPAADAAVEAASDDAGPALADFLTRAARECASRASDLGLPLATPPQKRLHLHRTASQQKDDTAK